MKEMYVGSIGERLEVKAVYQFSSHWTHFIGYMIQTMYCHSFKDKDGNVLIWKTASSLGLEEGQEVTLKGTVKDHSEYKDEKQTVLTRCKITE